MIVLKHKDKQLKAYRYLQNVIEDDLIHTTTSKNEAKRFKNARVLKGKYKNKLFWEREYTNKKAYE